MEDQRARQEARGLQPEGGGRPLHQHRERHLPEGESSASAPPASITPCWAYNARSFIIPFLLLVGTFRRTLVTNVKSLLGMNKVPIYSLRIEALRKLAHLICNPFIWPRFSVRICVFGVACWPFVGLFHSSLTRSGGIWVHFITRHSFRLIPWTLLLFIHLSIVHFDWNLWFCAKRDWFCLRVIALLVIVGGGEPVLHSFQSVHSNGVFYENLQTCHINTLFLFHIVWLRPKKFF